MEKNFSLNRKLPRRSRPMRGEFKKRFGWAVTRRLSPYTGIHAKELAAHLDCDIQTVYNAMNARHTPSGEVVGGTIEFFTAHGDEEFLTEIFPSVVPIVQQRKKEAEAFTFMRALSKFAESAA